MNGGLARTLPTPFGAFGRWPAVDWWRGLAQGLLFGVAMLTTDAASLAIFDVFRENPWHSTAAIALGWVVPGALIAWTAQALEGRAGIGTIVLPFLALAPADAAAWSLFDPIVLARQQYGWIDGFAFRAWKFLFFGGCFFAYCLLAQRARRVEALFGDAERERLHSATLVDEARADALAARVQPGLLLRALGAVRAAYPRDPAHAQALLDSLTDFLRLAMPAVRGTSSTLRGELSLLSAWSTLVALLETGAAAPRLLLPPGLTAASDELDPPFPPRILIPLAERMLAKLPADAPPLRMAAARDNQGLRLIISADGVALDEPGNELAQRIARSLREPHHGSVRIEVGAAGCVIDLRLPASAETERRDDSPR